MTEKMPWHEVMNETALLIESLNESERRQVMAALAERFGLKMTEKTAGGRGGYRPAPGRGKAKSW